MFLLSSLGTAPNFMPIPLLVLRLWKFSFIRNLTWNQEIGNTLVLISGDWSEVRIPNLAWMSLIKRYSMLQNVRFTAFTVSELLRKNQHGVKMPSTPRLWLKDMFYRLLDKIAKKQPNVKTISTSNTLFQEVLVVHKQD